MKRIAAVPLLVLLALHAAVQAGAQPPNCFVEDTLAQGNCQCSPCECCEAIRPAFYVRTEGVFLRRDVQGATAVATQGTNPENIVLSTTLFDEPFRAGPKLLIGHTFGDSPYGVEFSFFTVSEWQDGASVRRAGPDILPMHSFFSPFTNFGNPVPRLGFDFNNFVGVREISDLDSEEVNLRHLLPML